MTEAKKTTRTKKTAQEIKAAKAARAKAAKAAAAKAAASARKRATKTTESGFLVFIREQGVVGLAIGLVIGTQVKMVVDQLISSFINPLIGLILPGEGDLSQKKFTLTVGDKTAIFEWGQFVYVLISFIAVAAIIYYIIHGLKLDKIDKKKK